MSNRVSNFCLSTGLKFGPFFRVWEVRSSGTKIRWTFWTFEALEVKNCFIKNTSSKNCQTCLGSSSGSLGSKFRLLCKSKVREVWSLTSQKFGKFGSDPTLTPNVQKISYVYHISFLIISAICLLFQLIHVGYVAYLYVQIAPKWVHRNIMGLNASYLKLVECTSLIQSQLINRPKLFLCTWRH